MGGWVDGTGFAPPCKAATTALARKLTTRCLLPACLPRPCSRCRTRAYCAAASPRGTLTWRSPWPKRARTSAGGWGGSWGCLAGGCRQGKARLVGSCLCSGTRGAARRSAMPGAALAAAPPAHTRPPKPSPRATPCLQALLPRVLHRAAPRRLPQAAPPAGGEREACAAWGRRCMLLCTRLLPWLARRMRTQAHHLPALAVPCPCPLAASFHPPTHFASLAHPPCPPLNPTLALLPRLWRAWCAAAARCSATSPPQTLCASMTTCQHGRVRTSALLLLSARRASTLPACLHERRAHAAAAATASLPQLPTTPPPHPPTHPTPPRPLQACSCRWRQRRLQEEVLLQARQPRAAALAAVAWRPPTWHAPAA